MIEDGRRRKIQRVTSSDDVGDREDRLGNLPVVVIHHIFSFLNTIDVIKTSVLSRKWRDMWLSLPYLNFDINDVCPNAKLVAEEQERYFKTIDEKFKDFVNWVLFSQNRSISIQRMRLSCYRYSEDYSIYRWMNAAARRNVQELEMFIASETPIELPICLVRCGSLELLKLELRLGDLKLPSFSGFKGLKSLILSRVELSDYISFRKFISNCPLLENLLMGGCIFRDFKSLEISSNSLKNLEIDNLAYAAPGNQGLRNCELKVVCPSLVFFRLLGHPALDYYFEGSNSSLASLIYFHLTDPNIKRGVYAIAMGKLLKALCHAEVVKLCLDMSESQYFALDRPFSTSYCNLKYLALAMGTGEWNVEVLISLLDGSPCLEALTIFFDELFPDEGDWEILYDNIPCLEHHLKTITLYDFEDTEDQLEVLRFMLEHGRVLKKISINWVMDVEIPKDVISEIKEFPKSSPNVELNFIEPKSHITFGLS